MFEIEEITKASVATIKKGSPMSRVFGSKIKVPNNPGIPIANNTLNTFEPTTLPITISVSFLISALIDTTISGKDVPRAIAVIEIIASPTPNVLAILTVELKTKCDDTAIKIE